MHTKEIVTAGSPLGEAKNVLLMLHGRGATARDILSLQEHLQLPAFALVAPQATNNTWYPYSFLAPPAQNEPWLSSALEVLAQLMQDFRQKQVGAENVYLLGFSQGACLALEFAARNATRYGGIVAFTGGLIGDRVYRERYKGDFAGTPVFIGTGNPDFHVPVERVYATANILQDMQAEVTTRVYDNMGHTINQDEITLARRIVFKQAE